MKSNKFSTILYLVVLIFVFIMSSGAFYAYYKKANKNIEDNKIIMKKLNLLLKYENGNKITADSIRPGWEKSFTFSVENFSADTIGNYKIIFEIITPLTNIIENNFIYTLNGESNSNDVTNKVITKNETPIPIVTKEIDSGVITPGNIQTYTLNMKLKDNHQNQNYLKGKVFVAQIKVINNYD